MIESKITFTFTFKVEDRSYAFNIQASNENAALQILMSDIQKMISNISDHIKDEASRSMSH